MRLVIGSKNLSSWSLRAWLVLRVAGLPFEEVVVPLARADTRARLAEASPSGKVPVLQDGPVTIWDSLAIAEYAAELVPTLWPEDRATRALARAYAAEMHAGFVDLRTFLPFDATARFEPPGKLLRGVARDLERIQALWRQALERRAPGGFLFGRFSIADAMFAPVASRCVTYALPLDPVCARYVSTVIEHPAMRQWMAEAAAEMSSAAAAAPPAIAPAAVARPADAPAAARPARPALPPRATPFDARQVTRPAPARFAASAPETTAPGAVRAPTAMTGPTATGPTALPAAVTYLESPPPEPAPAAERSSAGRVPMRPADAGFARRDLPPPAPAPRRAPLPATDESGPDASPPASGEAAATPEPAAAASGTPASAAASAATAPAATAPPSLPAEPPAAAGEPSGRPVNRFAAALSAGRLAWQRRQEELGGTTTPPAPPARTGPRGGGIKPIGSGIHRRR